MNSSKFGQLGISVQEYSSNFTKLPKCAPFLVSNPRDEMSYFLTGVSDDLGKECCCAILHDNMDIYRLNFHAQQVEENRLKRKNRELKRAKSYEGGTYKGRVEIQDKPRFKKSDSNKVPSNL